MLNYFRFIDKDLTNVKLSTVLRKRNWDSFYGFYRGKARLVCDIIMFLSNSAALEDQISTKSYINGALLAAYHAMFTFRIPNNSDPCDGSYFDLNDALQEFTTPQKAQAFIRDHGSQWYFCKKE